MKEPLISKAAICLLVLFAILYLFLVNDTPRIGVDNSIYIILGKSLVSGQGYTCINLVGNPPHTGLPFIFPLLLAPIVYFFGYNFLALKLLGVIMTIFSLWFIYLLFKSLFNKPIAILIMILTAISAQILFYTYEVMAEIPYLFFSIPALIFIEKYKDEKEWLTRTALAGILFSLFAYFTREVGLSLLTAILLYLFLEREPLKNLSLSFKKALFSGFLFIIPVGLWQLRKCLLKGTEGLNYLQMILLTKSPFEPHLQTKNLFDFLETIVRNIYAFAFYIIPRVLTAFQFPHRNVLALLLSGIAFYGFLHCLFKKRTITEYYVVLFMAILFIYPWSALTGLRFITPLIPFVFYYFIIGVKEGLGVFRLKSERLKKGIFVFIVFLLIVLNLKGAIEFAHKEYKGSSKEVKQYLRMVEWMKKNTPPDATFTGGNGAFRFLYCGRKSPPAQGSGALVIAYPEKILNGLKRVDYVSICYSSDRKYTEPVILENPDKFSLVYKEGDNKIYKVKR